MDEQEKVGIINRGDGAWEIPALGVTIRLKPLAAYTQNTDNPVQHSPRNFGTVLASIQKLGALRSGFSSKGKILGGNLTYEAMTEAGIEWVVEVASNGTTWLMHERGDLSEEDQQLAAYFDQASSFQATWNAEQVTTDSQSGLALSSMFYAEELAVIEAASKQVGEISPYVEGLQEENRELDDMADVSLTVTVPKKFVEAVSEFLANGETKTGAGFGRGVLKRCGLL